MDEAHAKDAIIDFLSFNKEVALKEFELALRQIAKLGPIDRMLYAKDIAEKALGIGKSS